MADLPYRGDEAAPWGPPWLESLIKEWEIQIDVDGGCMSVDLDDFLREQNRVAFLLPAAIATLPRTPGASRRTGELFIALLRDELKTNASSPIDYLSDAAWARER